MEATMTNLQTGAKVMSMVGGKACVVGTVAYVTEDGEWVGIKDANDWRGRVDEYRTWTVVEAD